MNYSIIIAEHNPLSNGHIYLINKAKELFPDEKIVVFMSGNFVERGEPALIDKYIRADHTIKAGADYVFELPVFYSLSSAPDFAYGGVKLASTLSGKNHLIFGSECGDIKKLYDCIERQNNNLTQSKIKANLKKGESFASSIIKSDEVLDEILSKPNNLLGVEYLKAINEQSSQLVPITIKRKDNYNKKEIEDFSSSSAIREVVLSGKLQKHPNIVPTFTLDDLKVVKPVDYDEIFSIFKYNVLKNETRELSVINGVSEGLEYRIVEKLKESTTFDEFLLKTKTKRYPTNKIKRIVFNSLLNITKEFVNKTKNNEPYLHLLKKSTDSPFIKLKKIGKIVATKSDYEKLNEFQKTAFDYDLLATKLYSTLTHSTFKSDFLNKI